MDVNVIVCDECQKEFLFQSVEIKELVIDDSEHGLHFLYDYFQCPHCGEVYTVCIDDNKSLELEKEFLQFKERVDKLRRMKKLSEGKVIMLQRKQSRLSDYRQRLLDTYSRAFTKIAKLNILEENK